MANFISSFRDFILDYPFMVVLICPFLFELYFLFSYSFYYINKKIFRKLKRLYFSIFDKDDLPYISLCFLWIFIVPIFLLLITFC